VTKLALTKSPSPYDFLPELPGFTLTSDDLVEGEQLSLDQVHDSAGGNNISPHLRWSDYPPETRSFAVTCFDPDAPTVSGWWHWLVVDIPSNVTELAAGASSVERLLPHTAIQMRNDFGSFGFGGAGPPPGDHPHRYYWAVTALEVPKLGLDPDTPNAIVGFNLTAHGLARAIILTTYQH